MKKSRRERAARVAGRAKGKRDSAESGKGPGAATREAGWRRFVPGGAVALVALGVVLAIAIPAPHSGGDNAGYLSLADALLRGDGYVERWDPAVPIHTKYPPVFPLVLAALMAVGATSWTTFKLVPALAVVAGTVLAFAWARRRVGDLAAAAVALLAFTSFGWLDASRWILSEPLTLTWVFLALWAAEGSVLPATFPGRAKSGEGGDAPPDEEGAHATRRLVLAAVATGLACFTRAAAAPLAVALLAVLALRRRWRATLAVGAGLAVPALGWVLRSRGEGGAGAYGSEFWMVNPYDPSLGNIGLPDLPIRAWANLRLYVGEVLPAEWFPAMDGAPIWIGGTILAGLAAVGWAIRIRERGIGVAELFAPAYLGLILVWPEVWSGSRFLLPLYPILLVHTSGALAAATRRFGANARTAVQLAGLLLLAFPAVPRVVALAADGRACRSAVEARGDVFVCQPPSFQEFRDAAAWAGANLPEGSVVLNRKPRIFHLLGGTPGRVFAFTPDPVAFLAEADRSGADYLLFDHLDGVSLTYLPAVIGANPGAFCVIAGWGGSAEVPGTVLLGILPEGERVGGPVEELALCPPSYRSQPGREPEREGLRIPLLLRE